MTEQLGMKSSYSKWSELSSFSLWNSFLGCFTTEICGVSSFNMILRDTLFCITCTRFIRNVCPLGRWSWRFHCVYLNLVKLTVILIDSCLMVLGSQFLLLVGWWYSWQRLFLVTKVHKVFDFSFLLGRAGSNNLLQFVDWWRISSGTIQELNGILGVNCSSFWNYSFSYGRMDKSYSFLLFFYHGE